MAKKNSRKKEKNLSNDIIAVRQHIATLAHLNAYECFMRC